MKRPLPVGPSSACGGRFDRRSWTSPRFREGNELAEALQNFVVTPETLKEMHPAYAIYVHVQNQMSVMAEQ
jgi:hypothetical protein